MSVFRIFLPAFLIVASSVAAADTLKVQKVVDDVYAIVGELGNRTPENLGNNATFGLVVTSEGLVLIDSGGTYDGAKALAAAIKTVSDKPVIKVINTGGQDHRWMGNGYFKSQGATVYASEAAVADQKARAKDQFFMLGSLVSDEAVKRTEPVHATETFAEALDFTVGDTQFELRHVGAAHTPGDTFVWLPQKSVMFTGDIVYIERMLGVIDYSSSKSWVHVFDEMATRKPQHLVPGHGEPTTLEHARKDTYDYLVFLREAVASFVDDGGDMSEIGKIDQSRFDYLLNYDILSGRNAQRVFTELEWE